MKYIIFKDDFVDTDVIEKLCQIELTEDVILVSPYSENFNDLHFDNNTFIMKNNFDIRPNNKNIYSYFPRVKMCLPLGLTPHFQPQINGMRILQNQKNIINGYELSLEIHTDDIDLNICAIKGQYTLYNTFNFYLDVYNRDMFLNHIGKYSGLTIKDSQDIISFDIIQNFIGIKQNQINEIYIIQSDYLYSRIPNL